MILFVFSLGSLTFMRLFQISSQLNDGYLKIMVGELFIMLNIKLYISVLGWVFSK